MTSGLDRRGVGMELLADNVSFSHQGTTAPALAGVSVRVVRRRLTAVLGPNGAGKSTLLKTLSGSLRPQAGRVLLDGASMAALGDRARSQAVAVVPQSEFSPFPVSVRELVSMGRYPHLGHWAPVTARDRQVVDGALERCSMIDLAERPIDALSGGERQRARIARALAQEAPILLLDEPTAGLDLRYRMEVFHLLRELCSDGLAVLLVTHDLNLASRFADHMLLLSEGRAVAAGVPNAVLERALLASVYEWPLRIVGHPGPGVDEGAAQAVALRREAVPSRPGPRARAVAP